MRHDMNGVVLWSDVNQQKAVIWCEDQGDLAFYSHKQREAEVNLHEGDLICFDITVHQNRRMVENPLVLAEAACSGLAQSLSDAPPELADKDNCCSTGAQIIPFSPSARQKQRDGASRRKCMC